MLAFAVAAVSNVPPAHVLEFCQSADPECGSHADAASNGHTSAESAHNIWKASVSNLTQHLELFRLSCKRLIEALPVDEIDSNFVRTVKNCIFSKSNPTPLRGPLRLAAVSRMPLKGSWI